MRVRRTGGAPAAVAVIVLFLGAFAIRTPVVAAPSVPDERCSWPMWGHDRERSFSTGCTTLDARNASNLRRIWFFNTHDVVTATPAVVGDTVYVGDWSGRFYALRRSDGRQRWVRETKVHPRV
ncbi:MAG: PQQ-binding-like beta-propeller repeat protein, partial [Acidimicrobiia bacterium]|nr:PQQ-binding-like beta-propeller repeat protein [Acidimicrobiia bacterium]